MSVTRVTRCLFCHGPLGELRPGKAYCSLACERTDHRPGWAWASLAANPGRPKVLVLPLVKMTPDKPPADKLAPPGRDQLMAGR